MTTIKCLRCGHEWVARVEKPIACARCKSYDYDKPIKKKRKRIKVPAK